MELIENYQKALDAIYEHVGICEGMKLPLIDQTSMVWKQLNHGIDYAENIEELNDEECKYGFYFSEHWTNNIFIGKNLTIAVSDVGNMADYCILFDNSKKIN